MYSEMVVEQGSGHAQSPVRHPTPIPHNAKDFASQFPLGTWRLAVSRTAVVPDEQQHIESVMKVLQGGPLRGTAGHRGFPGS